MCLQENIFDDPLLVNLYYCIIVLLYYIQKTKKKKKKVLYSCSFIRWQHCIENQDKALRICMFFYVFPNLFSYTPT